MSMSFADCPFPSHFITVKGHSMHYLDEGPRDAPVLFFIHGNPTSSYLWRNVIKPLRQDYRCIAVDLIGFGKSGKPDLDYRFATHYQFLDGFVSALELTQMTLVLHDWGGPLGFQLAQRSPHRVDALCFMETFPFTFDWDEFPLPVRPLFYALRRPKIGRFLIMQQNLFIKVILPLSVMRHLPRSVRAAYQAPFRQRAHRKPISVWPHELPLNDRKGDTWQQIREIEKQLPTMQQPMLLLRFHPGAVLSAARIDWLSRQIPHLDTLHCGKGLHYVPEDQPENIARGIDRWRRRLTQAATSQAGKVQETDHFNGPLSWYQGPSPHGEILAAWSDQGLAHLVFTDNEAQPLDSLKKRFPQSDFSPAPATEPDHQWQQLMTMPLLLVGTAYQRRVWRELLRIPEGHTRSYGQLASQLDSQPRAVGQAVGRNGIALRVPCHRVVKADGALGGYRWGLPLKQQLLEQEQANQA